jgi:hypothetical protein
MLFWELQYRAAPSPSAAAREWRVLELPHSALSVEVPDLQPGSRYAFRARACKRLGPDNVDLGVGTASPDGAVLLGEWSVEAVYGTKGTAPPPPARPAVAVAGVAAPGGGAPGKKAARRAKEAEKAAPSERQAAAEAARAKAEAEAEAERKAAQQAKDAAIQAALAAAAADYEESAAKASAHAKKQAAQPAAPAQPGAFKPTKSKKKAAKRDADAAPPGPAPAAPLQRPAPAVQQPAMLAPSQRSQMSLGSQMGVGPGGQRRDVQRQAAMMGMSVAQYLAHKEDEALQEAIKQSLALDDAVPAGQYTQYRPAGQSLPPPVPQPQLRFPVAPPPPPQAQAQAQAEYYTPARAAFANPDTSFSAMFAPIRPAAATGFAGDSPQHAPPCPALAHTGASDCGNGHAVSLGSLHMANLDARGGLWHEGGNAHRQEEQPQRGLESPLPSAVPPPLTFAALPQFTSPLAEAPALEAPLLTSDELAELMPFLFPKGS